ncbi:MAG TPA: extracellular solute-binding protein, partial [Thalassobaculum sp.]
GVLRRAVVGSFDSLNPFIVLGRPAAGLTEYVFPTLMARSWDEPFTLYGYVAETVRAPEDRTWIEFQLNPAARFADGTPITVEDVIFSYETLRAHTTPRRRAVYSQIESVGPVGERGVRFAFAEAVDRETPIVIGMMPVLSKAYWTAHDITKTTLEPPLGGGPYRIASVDPGRSIVYERVRDWWGRDLPFFRGQMNFDTLRYDYYRDEAIAFEAFKAGQYDYRIEFNPERWISAYDFPAAKDGRVTMMPAPHDRANGMRGFAFNTRRDIFADPRVRRALTYAFDFEAVNRTYLANQYDRIDSYFDNSALAAAGLPEGVERALLEPFRDQLPEEVFTTPFALPKSDGSGNNRTNLRQAARLLDEAGWVVRDGVRVNAATGRPLRFEILLSDAGDERVALAYAQDLKRIGVAASVRTVDSAEYTGRVQAYDFDMMIHRWAVSLSPGVEQYSQYWGSRAAEAQGTRNYPGVRSPVVDALARAVADAPDQTGLEAATAALDRVLLWGWYVVPLYFTAQD